MVSTYAPQLHHCRRRDARSLAPMQYTSNYAEPSSSKPTPPADFSTPTCEPTIWLHAADAEQTSPWLRTWLQSADALFFHRELAIWCRLSSITSLAALRRQKDDLVQQPMFRNLIGRTRERLEKALDPPPPSPPIKKVVSIASSSTDAPLPERQSSRNLLSRQASKLSKADVDADDGPPDDDDLFEESVWMESSSGSWVQPTHEHASTLQRARDSNQSKRA